MEVEHFSIASTASMAKLAISLFGFSYYECCQGYENHMICFIYLIIGVQYTVPLVKSFVYYLT